MSKLTLLGAKVLVYILTFDGFESGFMSCLLVNYFQRPENVPFFLVSSEEAVRRYLGVSWSYIEKFISA